MEGASWGKLAQGIHLAKRLILESGREVINISQSDSLKTNSAILISDGDSHPRLKKGSRTRLQGNDSSPKEIQQKSCSAIRVSDGDSHSTEAEKNCAMIRLGMRFIEPDVKLIPDGDSFPQKLWRQGSRRKPGLTRTDASPAEEEEVTDADSLLRTAV